MIREIRKDAPEILIYTRTPREGVYPSHLAYSAHFAVSRDGKHYEALNRNYGMLFASSTIGADDTICEKGLIKPWLFRTAGGDFGIAAIRVNADGSPDEESRGKILLWTSGDLFRFREIGLADLGLDVHVTQVSCLYENSIRKYIVCWMDDKGNGYRNEMPDLLDVRSISGAQWSDEPILPANVRGPEGAVNGNAVVVDRKLCDRIAWRWAPLRNTSIQVPGEIFAPAPDELDGVRATATYSDGSTAMKRVRWNTEAVDFKKPCEVSLRGTVQGEAYPFPLARGYADPDVLNWGGKYYFIATNDNANAVGLFVREADTVDGLFAGGAKEYLILDRDEALNFNKCFWAPEFHEIGGSLWLLFAVGGEGWGPQSHMMKLKPLGRVTDPDGWEAPIRVRKADGSFLNEDGITLDMTWFRVHGVSYLVWSYRRNIFTKLDTGSMLCIATIDEKMPWKLTCEPVLLSRPLFGWENIDHTINNEGPYAIVTEETVYLLYSAGAAGGYSYALGLLTARCGDDLLNPDSWTKRGTPVLSSFSEQGQYGPGHNTFYTDADGNLMIAYHAQETASGSPRCVAIRRVHFGQDGTPVFDLSAERDADPRFSSVQTKLIIP